MPSLKEFMLILTKLVSKNRQIKRCFRKLLQHKQKHEIYWMKRLLHEIVKNKPSQRTNHLVLLFKRFKKAFEHVKSSTIRKIYYSQVKIVYYSYRIV